jgi:hypothetical protein
MERAPFRRSRLLMRCGVVATRKPRRSFLRRVGGGLRGWSMSARGTILTIQKPLMGRQIGGSQRRCRGATQRDKSKNTLLRDSPPASKPRCRRGNRREALGRRRARRSCRRRLAQPVLAGLFHRVVFGLGVYRDHSILELGTWQYRRQLKGWLRRKHIREVIP